MQPNQEAEKAGKICVTNAKMHTRAVKNRYVTVVKMVIATNQKNGARVSMTMNELLLDALNRYIEMLERELKKNEHDGE